MGNETPDKARGVEFYNEIYRSDTPKHYSKYLLYPIWQQVAEFLGKPPKRILEVGCGSGALAHYLNDLGFNEYTGFDFSDEAIKAAKARINLPFFVGDAYEIGNYKGDYDITILIEVLEHIANDYKVIENIKPKTEIIFSVPNIICDGHTRWFGCIKEIKERYKGMIDILHSTMFVLNSAKWFVCHGVRCG